MSKRVSPTLSDALYDAALALARIDGNPIGNDPGISSVIRKALRMYASQQRHSKAILDMSDDEYRKYKEDRLEAPSERPDEQ